MTEDNLAERLFEVRLFLWNFIREHLVGEGALEQEYGSEDVQWLTDNGYNL